MTQETPQANEPIWLGTELAATVTKCEVVEDKKKGKQLLVGLGIRVEDGFSKHLPDWTIEALEDGGEDHVLTACKLTQAGCRIGVDFKGPEDSKSSALKVEMCQLAPGLTIRAPADPAKRAHVDANIRLKLEYSQERVRYFGDRLDTLIRFRAFSAKTEQNALPLKEEKKARAKR